MTPNAVQIVIASKLTDPAHRPEFLRLSAVTEAWLKRQPGFMRYQLFETAEGWFDTMLWRDQEAADVGNAAFMATDIARQFARIVRPDYRVLSGRLTAL